MLVPVPVSLTRQPEVPQLPETLDTLSLGAVYKQTVIRLMQANGQLAEISKLGESE